MPITRYNEDCLESVADEVLNALIAGVPSNFDTPRFETLSVSARANAILACSVVERFVSATLDGNRAIVKEAWQALGDAGKKDPSLFDPKTLRTSGPKEWVARLAKHAPMPSVQWPAQLGKLMVATFGYLVANYRGDASRLARVAWFWLRPAVVERRLLNAFPAYQLDNQVQNRANARVFLKVAIRERVWPRMEPGPFMVPWASTVARFMVNTGCLMGVKNEEELNPSDPRVEDLIAGAVVTVAQRCFARFNSFTVPQRMALVARFNLPDHASVRLWHMTEAVDFWIWDHGGSRCSKLAEGVHAPPDDPCKVGRIAGAGCLCERNDKRLVAKPKSPDAKR